MSILLYKNYIAKKTSSIPKNLDLENDYTLPENSNSNVHIFDPNMLIASQ